MKKYYVILNDYIIDTVIWDGESDYAYPFPHDVIMEAEGFEGIGWSIAAGTFLPPEIDEEPYIEEQ